MSTTPPRPRLHPCEVALIGVLLAQLVAMAWALGGATLWSQLLGAFLGSCCLAVSLIPRRYTAELGAREPFRVVPARLLLRFPVFWLGLALFALIAIQGLNPAWQYHESDGKWWLQALAYRHWLPRGIDIPFNWPSDLVYPGEWRMLLIYVPAWMAVCATWIGITRRRTLQVLFTTLAVSGVALAIVGIAQRATGATAMYGWYKPSLPSFFGPFVYKNHGGAYLLLVSGVSCGLGFWHHVRGVQRLEKSSPAGVFVFFVICMAIAVLTSYARGATLGLAAYLVGVGAALGWYRVRVRHRGPNTATVIACAVALAGFVAVGLATLHVDTAWTRLVNGFSDADGSVEARVLATRASGQMLADDWAFGTGSGSFPFLFVPYQHRNPFFANAEFWPHAHNDILELAVELGIVGVLIIAACFGFWVRAAMRTRAWRNPFSGCVLAVAVLLLVMAWGDYFFFSPAVLLTWCCLWPAAIRWAEVEERSTLNT